MSESSCARIRVRKLNLCMYVHSKHANTHCTYEIHKSSPADRQNAYSMHTYAWMWQNAYDAKQCIHFAHTGTWLQSKSSPQKARTPRKRWHPGTLGIVRIDRISLHQPFPEYRHSLFRTTTTYISTLSLSLSVALFPAYSDFRTQYGALTIIETEDLTSLSCRQLRFKGFPHVFALFCMQLPVAFRLLGIQPSDGFCF